MSAEVRIVATPKDDPWSGMAGGGLDGYRRRIAKRAPSLGWESIDYGNLQDLLIQIRLKVTKATFMVGKKQYTGGCLRVLEINAHGSPRSCNGIKRWQRNDGNWDFSAAEDFAQQLSNTITLCDRVDIFFSGCNTGLADPDVAGSISIAQQFAGLLRQFSLVSPQYPHQIAVYGTRGIMTGLMMERANVDHGPHVTADPQFPGSTNATGPAAWNEFHNGW